MAKVGVEIGMTMHIGRPENNEYLKFTVRVDEIDTERPVPAQLEETRNALNELIPFVEAGLEKKIKEAMEGSSS